MIGYDVMSNEADCLVCLPLQHLLAVMKISHGRFIFPACSFRRLETAVMMSKAISFALVVLCVSAGARELQQAAAPAPSAKPIADLLFIFSADKVSAAIPHSVLM